jgi:CO/xanthine dehydrogenase Mo-binding subunit
MEPSCAVAEIKDGKLTCWSSSQATHDLRQQLASMLSMPDTMCALSTVEGSGCYGRNGHEDAAADAVLLARGGGATGTCAVDARGRAWVGSERAADAGVRGQLEDSTESLA